MKTNHPWILTLCLCMALVAIGCKSGGVQSTGKCHIAGTVSTRWNGVRVFLVPIVGPQDAAHVDSVEIRNGSFEFAKDTVGLYDVRVDYHYRDGLDQLIICTEPGELKVHLSQSSEVTGSPQNDSLMAMKRMVLTARRGFVELKRQLAAQGVAEGSEPWKQQVSAFQTKTVTALKAFAERQPEGVVRQAVMKMYH